MISCSWRNDIPSYNQVVKPAIQVTVDNDKTISQLKQDRNRMKLELESINLLIKEKELEQVVFYSKLVGYSSLGLATLLLILSFFILNYPLLPTLCRYASYTLGAVGFIALTIPTIYPLLIPIGLSILAIILLFSGYMWLKDRSALTQVVNAVELTKNNIPDYKDKFRQVISSKSNKVIDHIRSKIK
jgi:hypothetical protein